MWLDRHRSLLRLLACALVQCTSITLLMGNADSVGQSTDAPLDFQKADRRVVRLPSSSFPHLPSSIRRELNRRRCKVPQVWGAAKPGNVISGPFIQAGETDWAVLCSVNRISSILIFRKSSSDKVIEIAREADINGLQGEGGDQIGYGRAISPVGRDFIMLHYQAYGGVKPPHLDHLGIDDAFVEKASIARYFFRGKWLELAGAD